MMFLRKRRIQMLSALVALGMAVAHCKQRFCRDVRPERGSITVVAKATGNT